MISIFVCFSSSGLSSRPLWLINVCDVAETATSREHMARKRFITGKYLETFIPVANLVFSVRTVSFGPGFISLYALSKSLVTNSTDREDEDSNQRPL